MTKEILVKWGLIRHHWEVNKKSYAELSRMFNVKTATIKSRKSREEWDRENPIEYDEEAEEILLANKQQEKANKQIEARNKAIKIAQENAKTLPAKIVREVDAPATVTYTRNGVDSEESLIDFLYDENDGLTEQQRLFCYHYLICFNATQAYANAYACKYTTAKASGYLLLRNEKVLAKINEMKVRNALALQIDAQEVLDQYVQIALSDMSDYAEWGTQTRTATYKSPDPDIEDRVEEWQENFLFFKDSQAVNGRLVQEVSFGKNGASIKLIDKHKALDFLAKYTDLTNGKAKATLEQRRLELEVKAKEKELNTGLKTTQTIIVSGEDEMRRILAERKAKASAPAGETNERS